MLITVFLAELLCQIASSTIKALAVLGISEKTKPSAPPANTTPVSSLASLVRKRKAFVTSLTSNKQSHNNNPRSYGVTTMILTYFVLLPLKLLVDFFRFYVPAVLKRSAEPPKHGFYLWERPLALVKAVRYMMCTGIFFSSSTRVSLPVRSFEWKKPLGSSVCFDRIS